MKSVFFWVTTCGSWPMFVVAMALLPSAFGVPFSYSWQSFLYIAIWSAWGQIPYAMFISSVLVVHKFQRAVPQLRNELIAKVTTISTERSAQLLEKHLLSKQNDGIAKTQVAKSMLQDWVPVVRHTTSEFRQYIQQPEIVGYLPPRLYIGFEARLLQAESIVESPWLLEYITTGIDELTSHYQMNKETMQQNLGELVAEFLEVQVEKIMQMYIDKKISTARKVYTIWLSILLFFLLCPWAAILFFY